MNRLPGVRGTVCHGRPSIFCVGLRGKIKGDLRLQWVSVLELVDEDVRVQILKASAGGGVVAQQIPGPYQEVVKGGHAFGLALSSVPERKVLPEVLQDGQGRSAPDCDLERPTDLLSKSFANFLRGAVQFLDDPTVPSKSTFAP